MPTRGSFWMPDRGVAKNAEGGSPINAGLHGEQTRASLEGEGDSADALVLCELQVLGEETRARRSREEKCLTAGNRVRKRLATKYQEVRSMVSFQVSGQPALRFKVAARSVLFAGSRRGQVEQPGLPRAGRAVPPPRVRVLRGLRDRRRCGVPRGAGPLSVRPRRGVRRLRVRPARTALPGPRGCSPRRWCPVRIHGEPFQ